MRSTLFCLLALVASAVPHGAQNQRRANLLLVTIEALRADRVGERLTPTLTALAARGARFDRAYTHAPLTLPAHASLLTGLLPPSHGARNNGFRVDDAVITLAETLAGAGYRAGAFVAASALDARFGLSQGFDHYDDRYEQQDATRSSALRRGTRAAASVLGVMREWTAGQAEPWFAWCHLPDPGGGAPDTYDRAVAEADRALGALLTQIERSGVLDRTLIVVTADHGAALGDHGERTHGVFAYEAVMRVPLIVAGPGVPRRAIQSPAVAHVDVVPTVLQLLNVAGPASDGESRVAALEGEAMDQRAIYFEALDTMLMRGGAPLTGVVFGGLKFIDLPIPELYDLVSDPAEQTNRADRDAAMVRQLRDATVRLRTTSARGDAALALAEPEARARLRSLGYVGAASWRLGSSRVEDDPKRLLPLHLAYDAAVESAASHPEEAIRQLRHIIAQRPDFAAAVDAAGALLIARGRPSEAIVLLNDARAGGLRHRVLAERLAAALLARKDPKSAVSVLTPVVDSDTAAADARFLLGRAYSALGDRAAATTHLEAALEIDPTFEAASQLLARVRGSPR